MKKKANIYIWMILLLLVSIQFEAFSQVNRMKTRGVWMWGSTLSSQGTQTVVNKLKDNYINKVFLLVKGTGGTKTSASVLNEFIPAAHQAGIEVHFWYIVGSDQVYISSHPDAVIYHSPRPGTSDDPYPMTGDDRVNLLYPGYKDYVLENIAYFLNNFDCDGIHLDVIRYSHVVYSFDQNQLARADSLGCDTLRLLQLFRDNYSSMSGSGFVYMYTNGDSDLVKWVNMRKNIIREYISAIKDSIQQIKPGIELSAAFMPEGAYDPYLADSYYAQSYSLNSPLLDEISPMSYYYAYGQTTDWLKTVTAAARSQVTSNCKISAGYQSYDAAVTAQQVQEQIQYALEGGAYGTVNFRYGTTTDDEWAVIKTEYKNILDAEPEFITNEQMLELCNDVCSFMTANTTVPDSVVLTDSTGTTVISAADFYFMMVNYLSYYGNHTYPSTIIPIIRDILGPINPSGVQTGNQIQLPDILSISQTDYNYINSNKTIPNYVTVDTVDYDPPAMFWVYARTIKWYRDNSIMPNYAAVRTCSGPNTWTYGDDISDVEVETISNEIPTGFKLEQNYPNPFNPTTNIEFKIAATGKVTLKIFDVLGREVETLIDKEMNAGSYKIDFNSAGLSSGIYFYRLTSGDNVLIKKMTFLK